MFYYICINKQNKKTMELTKEHREVLIYKLEQAMEDAEIKQKISETRTGEIFEISCYLAKQHVEAIKQALIDNEIDY